MHGSRVVSQEVLHSLGVLGQRIAVFLVTMVCTPVNLSPDAFADFLTIAVVRLCFHILNVVIYVVPEEMKGVLKKTGAVSKQTT